MKHPNRSAAVIRWLARILGSLLVVITLIIGIGEMVEGFQNNAASARPGFPPVTILIFIFWGLALAGLVVAWWKEGFGGFFSLGCFIQAMIMTIFNPPTPNRLVAFVVFLIFMIPSGLYIWYWAMTRNKSKSEEADRSAA